MKQIGARISAAWRRQYGVLRLGAAAAAVLALGVAVGLGLAARRPPPEVSAVRAQVEVPIPEAPAGPPEQPASGLAQSTEPPAKPPSVSPDQANETQQATPAVSPPLPHVAPPAPPQGEPAWLRYAVAAPPTEGKAMVAIVIDDAGLDRKGAEEAIHLPGPLTISFMTYASDLAHLTAEAHEAGHELLLHVPMEPVAPHVDPGPNSLLTSLSRDEVLRRLRWGLDRYTGYVGINNHMGSKFTASAQSMEPVMEELRARGLLFLDSRTAPNSVGQAAARQMGVPNAARDVFLDNEISPSAIAARLAEVEQVAHRHGSAIAIGHPHGPTLAALSAWLPTLAAKGLVLVPLTAIVRARGATG